MLKAIRALMIGFLLGVWGIVGSFCCLFRPFHPDNARIFGRILSFGGLRILGLKVTVEHPERLNITTPCIYVVNHQDVLDVLICGKFVAKRTVSIGKKSLVYLPFFGPLFWLSGNILIDRSHVRKALATMDKKTQQALTEKNTSIWIFPEGTRNPTPLLLPFKRGAFRTAIKVNVPIVPICIGSYPQQLDFNRFRNPPIKVSVLEPIPTTGRTLKESEALACHCREQMQETIQRLNAELELKAT